MNWARFMTASALLVVALTASNASAATWRFVNILADAPWCEFEMPLDLYMQSARFLEKVGQKSSGCLHAMVISGPITISDIETLNSLLLFYRSNPAVDGPFSIHLDSPGGSISAALAIASEIRDPESPLYQIGAFVGQGDQCLSSCVLILAAGFQRTVFGRVGIHRPRFSPGEFEKMGYENLQSAYEGLYNELSDFMRRTNIHPSFVDAMWAVHSSDIKYLDEADLSFFRLTGTDLVRKEEQTLRLVQECGESGPGLQRDFMSEIKARCTEANGKIDSDCFLRTLDAHPYGVCYERLFGN